jgi:predicted nucleic acid-binding protein
LVCAANMLGTLTLLNPPIEMSKSSDPFASSTATEFDQHRAAAEDDGAVIGAGELWIAAHAITARLILVTNNEREFRRVPD